MASHLTSSNLFETVYAATAEAVRAKDFARSDPWIMLMPRLATLCGAHFELTHASALDDLRKESAAKAPKSGSYGKFLLSAKMS